MSRLCGTLLPVPALVVRDGALSCEAESGGIQEGIISDDSDDLRSRYPGRMYGRCQAVYLMLYLYLTTVYGTITGMYSIPLCSFCTHDGISILYKVP